MHRKTTWRTAAARDKLRFRVVPRAWIMLGAWGQVLGAGDLLQCHTGSEMRIQTSLKKSGSRREPEKTIGRQRNNFALNVAAVFPSKLNPHWKIDT
jgi:hypothetical protein